MRESLADPALARHAGRFVWLELDFDKPGNQPFIAGHGVMSTPSLFVIDPAEETATAAHLGGLTLPELERFLDEGERAFRARAGAATNSARRDASPQDAALARADDLLGRGRARDAAAAYRDALRLAPRDWPGRGDLVERVVTTLRGAGRNQECAETAAAEASAMIRGAPFASAVCFGLQCAENGGDAPWAKRARAALEPLAAEAVSIPSILRDVRFQTYQTLMDLASDGGDDATVRRWGEAWLHEIETTTPASDDERSALDIARVDAASILGTPGRVLPALAASERAMPGNYNAALRFAQMAVAAKRYDDALAACERGLAHVTGPLGRSWLLQVEARALSGKGDVKGASAALVEARKAASLIGSEMMREHNLSMIDRMLSATAKEAP